MFIRCCFTPEKKHWCMMYRLVSRPPSHGSRVAPTICGKPLSLHCEHISQLLFRSGPSFIWDTLWTSQGIFCISIQGILQSSPNQFFWKRNEKCCYKAPCWGGGLSLRADHMADGLIRAALDRYKQPKFPPVLQSAAPCVAYIYSPVCSVRAHNSFSIAPTFAIANTSDR